MSKKQIATFLAPNLGLSIVGSHAYAFSGAFPALNSAQTLLDFSSGNDYIVATLTLTAPLNFGANVDNGIMRGWQLDFNGQTVGTYKADTINEDMPSFVEVQILIPPRTTVVLQCIDSATHADFKGTANLTGKVHNA